MLRHFTLIACFFALTLQMAHTQEQPSVKSVAANPKSYIGKKIKFANASCADEPGNNLHCLVSDRTHTIRIEASVLGPSGGETVVERLLGPCKGKDKLGTERCQFDIQIEPRSAQSEAVMLEFEGERVTRLYSGIIEMRPSKR